MPCTDCLDIIWTDLSLTKSLQPFLRVVCTFMYIYSKDNSLICILAYLHTYFCSFESQRKSLGLPAVLYDPCIPNTPWSVVSTLLNWPQSCSCPLTYNDSLVSGSLTTAQTHHYLRNHLTLFLLSSLTDRTPAKCRYSSFMFAKACASWVWGHREGKQQVKPPQP